MENSNTSRKYIESLYPEQLEQFENEQKNIELLNKSLTAGFNDVETENLSDTENVYIKFETLVSTLEEWAKSRQMTYYAIVHDKDKNPETGAPSPTHYHIVIRFASPCPKSDVVKKFPVGYPEKTKSALASVQYLVHKNHPKKYQYSWDDVKTNDLDLTWAKVTTRSQGEVSLTGILEDIESGSLLEYQIPSIPAGIYSKYKNQIQNAFEHRGLTIMQEKNRNIEVYYITGETGIGKTTYAKDLADSLTGSTGCYCVSSGSNDALQDYKGEPVLIMDDLRADSFKLHDFLKLTDNHTRSSTKSRYKNKPFLGDYIIITSIKPLSFFYDQTPFDEKAQLYRRVTYNIQITKNFITVSKWSKVKNDYVPCLQVKNYVKEKYPDEIEEPDIKLLGALERMGLTPNENIIIESPVIKDGSANKWKCDVVPDISEQTKIEAET
jgi:hypothetical protein